MFGFGDSAPERDEVVWSCGTYFRLVHHVQYQLQEVEWKQVGVQPENGKKLLNEDLIRALDTKTKYTGAELQRFNINDLTSQHFIMSGNRCFQPTGRYVPQTRPPAAASEEQEGEAAGMRTATCAMLRAATSWCTERLASWNVDRTTEAPKSPRAMHEVPRSPRVVEQMTPKTPNAPRTLKSLGIPTASGPHPYDQSGW